MQDDIEAVLGELLCEAEADAVAGACDEGPGAGAVVVFGERGGAGVEVEEAEESQGEEGCCCYAYCVEKNKLETSIN